MQLKQMKNPACLEGAASHSTLPYQNTRSFPTQTHTPKSKGIFS